MILTESHVQTSKIILGEISKTFFFANLIIDFCIYHCSMKDESTYREWIINGHWPCFNKNMSYKYWDLNFILFYKIFGISVLLK